MDEAEGKRAVEIARQAIEMWVKSKEKLEPRQCEYPKSFDEKSGAFVTLFTYPNKELRGCIGYPEPSKPLIEALIDSAVSATQDPRFPPLLPDELNKVVIHVSILTKPEIIIVKNPKDYPDKIKRGDDGLIIEMGYNRGLLLPEVAEEYNMDAETFLSQTCLKAGLQDNAWLNKEIKIYKFQSKIFKEKEPNK